MPDSVKPRRSYRSTLRVAQAEQTRQHVLAAARDQFAAQGWTKTTIAAIARAAGVSAETIYATFGSKSAILEQLIQDALRGASPDTPLMDQPEVRGILGTANRLAQIRRFSADITAVLGRVAPLVAVARTAAERDPGMHNLYHTLHAGRRRNLALLVEALDRTGALRGGMTKDDATDQIFRIVSPELFLMMRDIEGLSETAIADWIEIALTRLLSDERPGARQRPR